MEENTNSSTENTESSNKNGLVAGIVIALIVLIGALVYYNFFYQKEEPVIVQQEAPKPAPAPVEPEPVIEEPIVEEVVPTLEYVQSRAGRYFGIVGSFIDDDLAADLAKKLMSEGTSCKIIYPFGNKLFYRLSVSDFDNVQDVYHMLRAYKLILKKNYGFLNTKMILLQAISTFQADSTMVEGAGESLSVLELLLKGGYFIIPLALLWLVAIYIFFERMLTLKKAAKTSPQFLDQVKSLVQAGDVNGARLLCSQENSPVSKMISKGISRIGSPLKNIEVAIENVGKVEINRLEKTCLHWQQSLVRLL